MENSLVVQWKMSRKDIKKQSLNISLAFFCWSQYLFNSNNPLVPRGDYEKWVWDEKGGRGVRECEVNMKQSARMHVVKQNNNM